MPPSNGKRDLWIKTSPGRLCACGCGTKIKPSFDRYYRRNKPWFVAGHQMRGKNHGLYKNGTTITKGYFWVLVSSHPRRTPRGYVKRCWLVMEKKLGRYLKPGELVHHRNHNSMDDRPSNLELSNNSSHAKEHAAKRSRFPNGRWKPR